MHIGLLGALRGLISKMFCKSMFLYQVQLHRHMLGCQQDSHYWSGVTYHLCFLHSAFEVSESCLQGFRVISLRSVCLLQLLCQRSHLLILTRGILLGLCSTPSRLLPSPGTHCGGVLCYIMDARTKNKRVGVLTACYMPASEHLPGETGLCCCQPWLPQLLPWMPLGLSATPQPGCAPP